MAERRATGEGGDFGMESRRVDDSGCERFEKGGMPCQAASPEVKGKGAHVRN